MPTIENVDLNSAEDHDLLASMYETMKARREDMDKTGKDVAWRQHFRVAMCMCIG